MAGAQVPQTRFIRGSFLRLNGVCIDLVRSPPIHQVCVRHAQALMRQLILSHSKFKAITHVRKVKED